MPVELVVVIAILGILAAIAVPRLLGFQDRARQQADQQLVSQVRNAIALLYANGEITVRHSTANTAPTHGKDEEYKKLKNSYGYW